MSRRKSDDSRSGASKAVHTAASDRKASGKRTSGRDEDSHRDQEDESDDDEQNEDQDDEDEDEDQDDEDDDDEDDDEDDDDDDDEDDEDDDGPPSPRTRHVRSTEEDWIPNWAPWLVLIAIISAGLAGLLGLFGSAEAPTIEQIDSATSPAKTSSAARSGASDANAERIEARQILVAYQGARRAPTSVTRSKPEAEQRAREALAKARTGADFGALVAQYSDESGAATRGRRTSRFTRRQKVKAFSDAAFALAPGQISNVVETPFGYHVIQRVQ
ncbi:MAG: peptidylprolyl isomerase [Polyangiaceae bacterium]|nr:peptidylprolyl isomerase [Polyangiaceae bacterium]